MSQLTGSIDATRHVHSARMATWRLACLDRHYCYRRVTEIAQSAGFPFTLHVLQVPSIGYFLHVSPSSVSSHRNLQFANPILSVPLQKVHFIVGNRFEMLPNFFVS